MPRTIARSKKEKAEAKKAVEAQAAAGARALLLAAEHKRLQVFHVKKTKEAEDKTKAEMARRKKAEAEKKEAEKKASAEKKEMEAQIRILTLKLAEADRLIRFSSSSHTTISLHAFRHRS